MALIYMLFYVFLLTPGQGQLRPASGLLFFYVKAEFGRQESRADVLIRDYHGISQPRSDRA